MAQTDSKTLEGRYAKYATPVRPPDDAVVLTAREAAYVARVCYKTIVTYAKRKKNRPPVSWVGRHSMRFPRDSFTEWAINQRLIKGK